MKFYLTFPQKHPDRDRYRVIEAESYHDAHCEAIDLFGDKFAELYEEGFIGKVKAKTYFSFSGGKLGPTIIARKWKTDQDYKDDELNQPN